MPQLQLSLPEEASRLQAAKEKLAQLIREGMESGEGEEITDEYWERFDERLAKLTASMTANPREPLRQP